MLADTRYQVAFLYPFLPQYTFPWQSEHRNTARFRYNPVRLGVLSGHISAGRGAGGRPCLFATLTAQLGRAWYYGLFAAARGDKLRR